MIELETLKEIQKFVKEEVDKELAKVVEKPYHSKEITEINSALAKAQGEFTEAIFNRTNPYLGLQYVDLCNLIKATRPALTKYELALTQFTETPDDGSTILHTRLLHSSGQFMETRARILPVKNDIGSYESALNCQKRYSYMALLGIVPQEDPGDDDGELLNVKSGEYIAKTRSEKNDPRKQSLNVVSKHELEELEAELDGYPDLAQDLLDKLMIQSLADLPSSQYRNTLMRVKKIKQNYGSSLTL